jgi:cytochrome c-type biogenesis protein CcmH
MIVNTTHTEFLICSIGFSLVLALIVIVPWLRRPNESSKKHLNLNSLNVSIFKERLAELEADFQSKVLDAVEYFEQKTDLERQLLAAHTGSANSTNLYEKSSSRVSRLQLFIIFLIIPLISFSVYSFWNNHQSPQHVELLNFWASQDQFAVVADAIMTGKDNPPTVKTPNHAFELLQAMQVNAYQHPFDAKRWVNLSEAYMSVNAIEPALAALAHAYRLKPENNDIAMTYAQMRFFSLQGKMDSLTQGIVGHILAQNPDHEGALLLMSMVTYHDQHYSEAVYWLQRLKRVRLTHVTGSQPANPAIIAQLDQTIRDAEFANLKLAKVESNHSIIVDLMFADTIKSKLNAKDTLFVFVRSLQGSKAPFAVQKISATALLNAVTHDQVLTVTMSDANSMLSGRTISSAQLNRTPLVVAARISQYSNPSGTRGDLESLPVPIDQDSAHGRRYVVNIDQIRP